MTKIKIEDIGTVKSDLVRLEIIMNELQAMLDRDSKRPMSYEHLPCGGHEVIEEVIQMIDEYINWEPSDEEIGGEPPLSSKEMLDAAWKQHLEAHS